MRGELPQQAFQLSTQLMSRHVNFDQSLARLRSVTLTAEGSLFLERCRRIVAELEAAESELSQLAECPRGRLRL